MLETVGSIFYNILAMPVNALLEFVAWFLEGIVLSPAMIPSGIETVWNISVNISMSLIVTVTIYSAVKASTESLTGYSEDVKDIIGRAILAIFFAKFSWFIFIDFLLELNNTVVSGIIGMLGGIKFDIAAGWALPTISFGAAILSSVALGLYFILWLLGLLYVIAAIISWIVWLIRTVEIIGLIIVAPIAAGFLPNQNSTAWRWVVTEFLSAIFSQSFLSLFIFLSFFLMTGASGKSMSWTTDAISHPGESVTSFALGVACLFYTIKSHSWAKGFVTGRSVISDHSGMALGAGYGLGKLTSAAMPGGAKLAIGQAVGKMGLGEFSKGGRMFAAARSANAAKSSEENPGYFSAGMESSANANIAALNNPHTRNRVAAQAGLMSEVQSQGTADNAPAIQKQQARGQSLAARDPGARAARNQATVDSEIAYNQDPQVMAAKGISKMGARDYLLKAKNINQTSTDSMQDGFNGLADSYHSFGYGREGVSNTTPYEGEAGLVQKQPRNITTTNPYTRNMNGGK